MIRFIQESAITDKEQYVKKLRDPLKSLGMYSLNQKYLYMINKDVYTEAIDDYGNTEAIEIYRGINFATEEEFNEFLKKHNNKVKFDKCSSWTTSYGVAEGFAESKKSYNEYMSPYDPIIRLYDKMSKEREKIMGYKGVVLKMKLPALHGIMFDKINDEMISSGENEVLVIPGTYEITIDKTIQRYEDDFKNQDVSDIVLSFKKGEDFSKEFDWLLLHRKEELKHLSEKANNHLFNLTFSGKFIYNISDGGMFYENRVAVELSHFPRSDVFEIYSDKNKAKVIKIIKPVLKECLTKVYTEKYYDGCEIVYNYPNKGIIYWVEQCGLYKMFLKLLKNSVTKYYHSLNSMEEMKRINAITNPKEKMDEIKKHTEKLEICTKNFMV